MNYVFVCKHFLLLTVYLFFGCLLVSIHAIDVSVHVGNDVVIVCPLTGNYTFPEWFGPPGQTPLTSNGTFTQAGMAYKDQKNLKLISAKTTHGGEYICRINNREDSVSLTVLTTPQLYIFDGVVWFSPTKTSRNFTCTSLKGALESSVTWTFSNISSKTYTTSIYPKCTQAQDQLYECFSTLTISNVTRKDTGLVISCKIKVGGVFVNTHSWDPVIVHFPPTYVTLTGNALVKLDDQVQNNLSLTCTTDPARDGRKSGIRFEWYKSGEQVKPNELGTVTYTEVLSGEYQGYNASQTVTFAIDREMNGVDIKCRASNFYNYIKPIEDTVTLDVDYSPKLREPALSTYRVYVGDTVVIPCSADSKPPAEFKWTSYSKSAPQDEVHLPITEANLLDNRNDFRIYNASVTDSLMYRCEASNNVRPNDTKSVELVVHTKPIPPRIIDAFDRTTSSLHLNILLPDPPSKLYVAYYGQYRRYMDPPGIWLELTAPVSIPVNERTGDVAISDLTPSTAYEVRVKMVDAYGLESYSTAAYHSTLAEDKEKMVTETDRTNAILISVFVTAGVFLIILVIVVWAIRKGKCGFGSAKGDITDNTVDTEESENTDNIVYMTMNRPSNEIVHLTES